MAFRLSDAEADRLRGMLHMDQVLYTFGLRRHMDYATGVVGDEARRISYQSLSETLFVEPIRGTKSGGNVSRWQIKRALSRLEREGLVETQGDFVFRLPLADCGEVRLKRGRTKAAHESAQEAAPEAAQGFGNENNEFTDEAAQEAAPEAAQGVQPKAAPPLVPVSVSKDTGTEVPRDPIKRAWRLWVELVGDTDANRRVLGRMMKEAAPQEVASAVAQTYAANPVEPVAYLRGCLKPKRRFQA